MEIKELREKNKEEISALLKETRERLRHLKFELSGKKLKNVREIPEAKKTIARILTILKQQHEGKQKK